MKPTENRKVLETATWQDDLSRQANKATVVSSTSGTKLLKIWKRWHYFTNKEPTVPKLFWGIYPKFSNYKTQGKPLPC